MEAGEAAEDGTRVLGDGRRLGHARYGRPEGKPMFYFTGILARGSRRGSPIRQRPGPACG